MFFFNIKGVNKDISWNDYIQESKIEYGLNIDLEHDLLKEILKLNMTLNFDKDSIESNHYNLIPKIYKFNQKYKEIRINSILITVPDFLGKIISNIISFFSNLMKFYTKINNSSSFNPENFKKAIEENNKYFETTKLNFEVIYNCLIFFFKYSLMNDYTNHQRNILSNISKIVSCKLMDLSEKKPKDINNTYSQFIQDFKNKKTIKEEAMNMEISQIKKININKTNIDKLQEPILKQMFNDIQLFSQEIKSIDKISQSSKSPIILTSVPIAAAAAGTLILPTDKKTTENGSTDPESNNNSTELL